MDNFLIKLWKEKKDMIIKIGLALAGFILIIVADVWLIGTAAAKLCFIDSDWYWQHPFKTAYAWLCPWVRIENPGVFHVWLFLNFLLIITAATLIVTKLRPLLKILTKKVHDRDIKKLKFKRINYNTFNEIERTPAGQVFLGLDDQRQPVRVKWSDMIEHVHILGGSGTGKTSFAIIPICLQAIRQGLPVVAIDFKGDKQAIQFLARETQKAGKKFYLFSLHPEIRGNTYNPIGSGSTISKVERIMTALELMYEGEAKFYSYYQKSIFIPVLKYFDTKAVKYTLNEIQRVLKSTKFIERITGDEVSPNQLKGLTAALTAYADLDIINDPEPDIDLRRIMLAGDVVYYDLRSAVAPELSTALGKMIAMDLQSLAAYRSQQDSIVVVAIDEFQNMACQAFRNIVAKVRSANYNLVLANQALGDLRAVGDDFLNTVVTNTRTKIIFNVDDPEDAEYFARKSGNVIISSESWGNSRPSGLGLGQTIQSDNYQDQEKQMIHSNVFLKLPFMKSVIYRRGELAMLANHTHLINEAEKDQLEGMPYPAPIIIPKCGVETVSHLIMQMKQEAISRNKLEKTKSHGKEKKDENDSVETVDITI